MSCRWCHNPETQRMKSMLMVDAARCIGCMRCTQVCESFACYRREDGAFVTARDRCINCLKCIDVCHAQARKASVCEIELDDLVKELLQDEVFYRTSGGGVTLGRRGSPPDGGMSCPAEKVEGSRDSYSSGNGRIL
ncbi:MAG: hypothetical protein V8R80_00435 [Eubacterium sp.]